MEIEIARQTQRTVLMAEPLDDTHDFYVSWFAGEGFDVVGTGRGDIALAMIDESAPDLLVVDFGLTGIDTLSVISRLRRSSQTTGLPILVLTRRDDVARTVAIRRLSAALLSKLGDTDILRDTVRRLLPPPASTRRPGRRPGPLIEKSCDDEWLARSRES